MKTGDLVRMKTSAWASPKPPPMGIIIESRHPDGHRFKRHTISWAAGLISEMPEDILMIIRRKNDEE